jgi:hypothetical protein
MAFGLTALLALALVSCTEEFPAYNEPTGVLTADLRLLSPDTLLVHYDMLQDEWFLNTLSSFSIRLTNRHDDLLEGKARIAARVVVQSFSTIPRTCVVEFSRGDLRSPTLFQGNLSLAPGGSAEFSRLWVPKATDGRMIFAGLPYTPVNGYLLYGPIPCIAWAEAQVFDRVQAVRTPDLHFSVFFAVE